MIGLRAALSIGCLVGAVANVYAEPNAPPSPAEIQQRAMEDPKICKRVVPTGSRIARRYCFRKSEWEAMREGGQRAAREANGQAAQYGYRGVGPSGTNPY